MPCPIRSHRALGSGVLFMPRAVARALHGMATIRTLYLGTPSTKYGCIIVSRCQDDKRRSTGTDRQQEYHSTYEQTLAKKTPPRLTHTFGGPLALPHHSEPKLLSHKSDLGSPAGPYHPDLPSLFHGRRTRASKELPLSITSTIYHQAAGSSPNVGIRTTFESARKPRHRARASRSSRNASTRSASQPPAKNEPTLQPSSHGGKQSEIECDEH